MFGVDYAEDEVCEAISVHGDLTFAGPLPGSRLWWLGFDCAHAWDLVPGLHGLIGREFHYERHTYKTIRFIIAETTSLAEQLKGLA